MQIESLFNGEVGQRRTVTTAHEICEASAELAMGDGWGQQIRGTEEELRRLGAHETEGGWVWTEFFCVVG